MERPGALQLQGFAQIEEQRVKLPHDPEHLEHLRGDQRRLLPVPAPERDLRDLLPRTETVVGDATPEALGPEAVVNAAAEFPGQVGAGFPWPFVDGEILRGGEAGRDAAQTAAALAVRFEAGVVLRRRLQHFELSGHEGFFSEVVRPRSVRNSARTSGQRLTLVLVADKEQIARLVGSAGDWNGWRAKNPKKRPDLTGADLRHTDLRRADLRRADLSGSDLSQANLSEARLGRADLTRALLVEADLIGADLSRAVLDRAALIGTYLLGAN